jgi:hypothetical protein
MEQWTPELLDLVERHAWLEPRQALRNHLSRTSTVASIDEKRAGNSQRHSPTIGPC